MQKRLIWLVPLALAGCKKSTVEMQNATATEVAEQMKKSNVSAPELQPGLWEATMKLESMTIPGADARAREEMGKRTGQGRTMTDCLTEEKAKKPFDSFVDGINKDCRYDHFKMGNGQIDSSLVCVTNGVTRKLAMQGTYKPTEYRMLLTTSGSGGPMNGLEMKMSLVARRTGDCPA